MKTTLTLLFAMLALASFAQTFKKYNIEDTGCSAYFPYDPGKFELSYSDDSAKVYTGSAFYNGFEFGAIIVEFNGSLEASKEERDELLVSYLDYLKSTLEITGSVGYGKGHTLESNPDAVGMIDYWEDSGGASWAVKAWTDNYHLAVLYVAGPGEYPTLGEQNMFLDGFRFP